MQLSNDKYNIEVMNDENYSLVVITFKGDHDTNQDSYNYQLNNDVLLAVADGLGSAANSHLGSKIATNIAINKNLIHRYTIETIFPLWKNELTGKQLNEYDTTLKLVKITSNTIKISSVGDGGIIYQKDNLGYNFLQDNLDYVNETNSLLQSNNLETIVSLKDSYVSSIEVMLFTDGFELVIDNKKLVEFLHQLKTILVKLSENELIEHLHEWINSWLDKNIYDDVTMIYYMKGV